MVIGNGNVAMDVARMLALTDHELRQTDTADHAIEALDAKQIREIVVLGRRGPVQAAFTNPEIKELGEMEDADVVVDPAEAELDAASAAYLESDEADKTTRVNVETLREVSQRELEGKQQRIVLRFLASPVEIKGDGRVEKIVIGRNELVEEGGSLRAKDSGEREELECGLVLRSVGYRGMPMEGVPFDEGRGKIVNDDGRVLDSHDAGHKIGHYTAGWIKRGPRADRDEQDRRGGDGPHLLADTRRGRCSTPPAPIRAGREASRRARRALRQLRGLAGDRPGRDRPRRAPRPPAGQVRHGSRRCSTPSARKSRARASAPGSRPGRRPPARRSPQERLEMPSRVEPQLALATLLAVLSASSGGFTSSSSAMQ